MKHILSIVLAIVLFTGALDSPSMAALNDDEIPPELARWRSWVLYGHENELCPTHFDNGAMVRCQWPSRLKIDVSADGGHFEQRWLIFSQSWVALPGSSEIWPDGVVVDGRSEAVIDRDNVPSVRLEPGEHHIRGRFSWRRMPEMMYIPPAVGLLSLVIDGQRVAVPVLDADGRLWLQEQSAPSRQEDRVDAQLFRLINDTIPMEITTLLRMKVSGQAREIRFKDVLIQNAVPMSLASRLPVRIDDEGQLLVQARPGRWDVRISARMPDAVKKITKGATPYGQEIWSFQAQHHLRMVEIRGVPQVEPGQTEMPAQWHSFPAYLIKAGTAMTFHEIRRGDPDPAPDQLSLHRRWWLDFDGGGFTIHDNIGGTLSRQWSLSMNPPYVLGRVAVDGKARVITVQGKEGEAGVELRRGHLQLQADARLPDRSGRLRAVGWDHDFQSLSAALHLPPGWRLLAASGVDQVSETWFQRWSLLDFFLVLIIALAVFKLRTWQWGLLALAAMVLIFHEPGAPKLVWLHILAVLALLPLLPAGWIKRLVSLWGGAAVLVLLVMAIPFAVQQIRWGIYPQLAPHNDFGIAPMEKEEAYPAPQPSMDAFKARKMAPKAPATSTAKAPAESQRVMARPKTQQVPAARAQDPDALIPTGPGLPDWHWNIIRLQWSGPVARDQTMRLYLLTPMVNLVLALLRVASLALLIWGVIDWRPWWQKIRQQINAGAVVLLILLIPAVGVPGAHAQENAGGFPPPSLLEELKQRLLEKSDCLPNCADISRLEVAVSGDELQLMLKVHGADRTAVPLPVNRQSWNPEQILLDNAPISGLARDEKGVLWAVVPAGQHTLVMLGRVGQKGIVHIPLPLKPHTASYVAKGWEVTGILPDGRVGSSIQLTRIRPQTGSPVAAGDTATLPVFLHVERVLHLGLTWQVNTTIKRVTPPGIPVVAGIPLLANESVTTAGLHVDQGEVLINMSADQRIAAYASVLKITPGIRLTAPRAVPWTETWVLDASPIWHCELSGIAVVHHQDRAGQWQPQWRPWPGESVTIDVQRPQAIEGQTMTVQNAHLTLTPGQRFGKGDLTLEIRTSRGGQHTIALPPKANLQAVMVNGKSLPIRQDGQWVTLPLQPGTQTVAVQWHQLAPFATWFRAPQVRIGEKAVNARVTINMPAKRWILLAGGPRWGPAVRFWSYLAVIVLAALGLSRLPMTPLRTWQWLLLGLGLTQIEPVMALLIIGWLLALGLRERRAMPEHWLGYNALQVGLILWTLVAMVCLFAAVQSGLIGQPEMQIAGNQSSSWTLNWTQDRIGDSLPRPWVFSLPVWIYRGLMLAWSLWMALALLGWLKWGWSCFAKDGVWRRMVRKPKKAGPVKKPAEGV